MAGSDPITLWLSAGATSLPSARRSSRGILALLWAVGEPIAPFPLNAAGGRAAAALNPSRDGFDSSCPDSSCPPCAFGVPVPFLPRLDQTGAPCRATC